MEGRPMPGGAQTVTPGPGSIQLQPAFMSVASVTPLPSADGCSPEERARADGWPASAPCVCLPDGIALGPDGDPQAPIPSPPNTTNKVHARLNTRDMFAPLRSCDFNFSPTMVSPTDESGSGSPVTYKESRG
jgi:hypothetical protein